VDPGESTRTLQEMVENQLRGHGVADEQVLAAMATVPRERLVPPDLRRHA
jgi:protein-L-isoaspartate O-methyltransferase